MQAVTQLIQPGYVGNDGADGCANLRYPSGRQLLAPERHSKIIEQQQISPAVHHCQLENGVKVWLKQFSQAENIST